MNLRLRVLFASAACAFFATPALAQQETAEADRLFDEALKAAQAGKYAEACPKLERSLALDPAIGTEFNLADCHEHLGRLASAWRHYRTVENNAHVGGKKEREQAAHARIEVIAPKLAWLKVQPYPRTTLAKLEIDGESVPVTEDSPKGLPIDPGSHQLTATSTAQDPWSDTVNASAGQSIVIKPFKDAKSTKSIVIREQQRGSTQRSIAIAVGAVGAAGLIVGGVTGIVSIANHNSAKKAGKPFGCEDPKNDCVYSASEPDGAEAAATKWSRATTFGTVSTVGFIVGGVAAAAAIVLYVTAPKNKPSSPTTAYVDAAGYHF